MSCLFLPFGTSQIMVGLFNIGLGPGRTSMQPDDLTNLGAAYWLGAVFIFTGMVSVSLPVYPRVCWLVFALLLNIAGAVFAAAACWLYIVDLRESSYKQMCDNDDKCTYVATFAQKMLNDMNVTLIVLAGLQLCVCIAHISLLGFILSGPRTKNIKDVEIQPLLKNDL